MLPRELRDIGDLLRNSDIEMVGVRWVPKVAGVMKLEPGETESALALEARQADAPVESAEPRGGSRMQP